MGTAVGEGRIAFLEQKSIGWHDANGATSAHSIFESALLCIISLLNHAKSTALDEYVLKMPLGVQIGSLGDENDAF